MKLILCLGGDLMSIEPETEFEKECMRKYFQNNVIVARKRGGNIELKFSTSTIVWEQEEDQSSSGA